MDAVHLMRSFTGRDLIIKVEGGFGRDRRLRDRRPAVLKRRQHPMSVIIYSTQHGGNGGPALNALGSIMLAMSLLIVILGYVGYRLLTRGEHDAGLAALTAITGET